MASNVRKTKQSSGLPDAVSHIYYKHGLFLSSYPTCATSIAIVSLLFSCYPIINLPLPGTVPIKITLPISGNYSLYHPDDIDRSNFSFVQNLWLVNSAISSKLKKEANDLFITDVNASWTESSPKLYIQQILIRSSVLPWTEDLHIMDAFRAPLYEIFKLLEIVRNHESNERTLDQICLRVDNVKRMQNENIFPEYNCLLLSPANLWGQNLDNFTSDTDILNTVFQHHNLQKSKVSTAEMVFGLPMQDTGLKRYPLRSRSRIIQYALTIFLKENNREFLESLRDKLLEHYPPPVQCQEGNDSTIITATETDKLTVTYIFYPEEFKLCEFIPLTIAFIVLFMYVYFSVRKIDVIYSRLLLALCAVVTVLGSLIMSLGLCSFFGLTISLHSKDIFPYLLILLGLENCLVITRSVASIDDTLDVKIRIAQALSKEGWLITKTLLTEITILTAGLATFVPVIQEFSIFAIVGLMSDFILQMLLFSTILVMNIKQSGYTTEVSGKPKKLLGFAASHHKPYMMAANDKLHFRFFGSLPKSIAAMDPSIQNSSITTTVGGGFYRSHSHPKLTYSNITNISIAELRHSANDNIEKIPKRLRIVNFWARTRFFQRAFMVWMTIWICSIVYNSGYLEIMFLVDFNRTHTRTMEGLGAKFNMFSQMQAATPLVSRYNQPYGLYGSNIFTLKKNLKDIANGETLETEKSEIVNENSSDAKIALERLRHPHFDLNYFLSNFHWSTIMKQYNVSLKGEYVTILPTIKLSHAIKPQQAAIVRNPNEKIAQHFQWKALAAALDPLDFTDNENRKSPLMSPGGAPLFPKSPMEIFFVTTLCCISVIVLCYTMVVFYRCICTRNYAEWRSSWNESSEYTQKSSEHILEGVPAQVVAHKHRIECLVADDSYIVSSCLKGHIKVWDARSGENFSTINRCDMQMDNYQDNKPQATQYKLRTSPVWCLNYFDNLIAVGCANGCIELWETPSGTLKCISHADSKRNQGITHVYINGNRVIAARLSGRLDFYRLETYYRGQQIDWDFTSAYRRTHLRTNSADNIGLIQQEAHIETKNQRDSLVKEQIKFTLQCVRLAHQQPITCMEVINDVVFTGSQDHTLKVYSLSDNDVDYTLHGHCGPISSLFVDRWQPDMGGSGSQDGLLCVWDLYTGTCMYSIKAHDGAVSCMTYSPSYVVSLGTDEHIRVWERFKGNLLTTIHISNAYSALLMLTPSLLVTSKMDALMVLDVRTGEPIREVKLDFSNLQLTPRHLLLAYDSVVCDYGNEIRIVRFPIMADKCN